MCSICRNKHCIYQFDKQSWKPDDGLVVINLPESDLTIMEQIRIAEDQLRKQVTDGLGIKGYLPEKLK